MSKPITPLMYGKARVNVMKAFNMTPLEARSWLANNAHYGRREVTLEKLAGPHGATIARMIAAKKEKPNGTL